MTLSLMNTLTNNSRSQRIQAASDLCTTLGYNPTDVTDITLNTDGITVTTHHGDTHHPFGQHTGQPEDQS